MIALRRMDRRRRNTNTRGDMRTLAATAVNRQKPKMVENEGPITLLPPPLSQSDYATSPIGVMHTHTHTHKSLTMPFPQTNPFIDEVTGREVISQRQKERWKKKRRKKRSIWRIKSREETCFC